MASARGSSVATRLEEMTLKTIGTHDGRFTSNETLACFMLRQLPEYKNAKIIRTRDSAVLRNCAVVVGVGETYCHRSKRYDHHQREFVETMNSLNPAYPWHMRLRSTGLVYFHYGRQVLSYIMERDEPDDIMERDEPDDIMTRIYTKIYEEFVQAIDAADNSKLQLKEKDVVVNYSSKTSLTARVDHLLPSESNTDAEQQEQFNKAMALTGSEFKAKVKYVTAVWAPAMALSEAATEKQFEVFSGSKLVHWLQGTPRMDRVFTVDEVHGTQVTRKLYRIARELPPDKWQVQLVSTKEEPHLVQFPVSERTLKRIGTHDGTFHCDEALACFMLRQLPEYRDAQVIRTSDPAMLDTCDVVVDVGGEYDHAHKRYDHHQSGFNKSMNSLDPAYPWKTPLSSAGLVYFHYGHRVLAQIMGNDDADEVVRRIFVKLYEEFVEAVDGFDNGMLPTDERQRFVVTTSLGDRITNLNPSWNDAYDVRRVDDQFREAMTLTGSECKNKINRLKTVWFSAREIVAGAFLKRIETDQSGEVVHLDRGCLWKGHLVDLETEQHIENTIKFVIFRDSLANQYVVQCVPESLGSRTTRLLLPVRWRGEKGGALQRASGIPDSSFVHRAGFVGYGRTYESVLQMARKALVMTRRHNP